MQQRRGLFVTGTGTGVGKSVVAAAVISALTAQGIKTAAFKPAVSGIDEPDPDWPLDHELLAAATKWQAPEAVTPHLFGPAVSPHLAARRAGIQITLRELEAAFERQAAQAQTIVCEGVGGLMVPLSDDPPLSVLDFAKRINLPAVVATHPGLGTISDTRLTVDRLRAEGQRVHAVVISGWPQDPSPLQQDNRDTLAQLLQTDVTTLPLTTPQRLAKDAQDLPVQDWIAPNG